MWRFLAGDTNTPWHCCLTVLHSFLQSLPTGVLEANELLSPVASVHRRVCVCVCVCVCYVCVCVPEEGGRGHL